MKKRLSIGILIMILGEAMLVPRASAQYEQLFFSDSVDPYSCNLSDDATGLFTIYVLHQTRGALSVSFAAPKPSCMVGVTYLQENSPFVNVVGDSQTGITVNYETCLVTGQNATLVMSISYFTSGLTPDCCLYPAVPHGDVPFEGCLMYEDCTGAVKPTGIDAAYSPYINRAGGCTCDLESDWTSPTTVNVTPADGAINVSTNVLMSWDILDRRRCELFDEAFTYMYFGTDPNPPYVGRFTGDSFDPGTLTPDETYYWKVELILSSTISRGPVRRFTTGEPVSVTNASWGRIKALYDEDNE